MACLGGLLLLLLLAVVASVEKKEICSNDDDDDDDKPVAVVARRIKERSDTKRRDVVERRVRLNMMARYLLIANTTKFVVETRK